MPLTRMPWRPHSTDKFLVIASTPAFAAETPYNVAWVQREEGPLLMTNIIGCELADIRIGMPVRVVYDEEANGMILPRFAPAGSQSSG